MSQILPYRPKHSSLETAKHHSDLHAIVLPPPPRLISAIYPSNFIEKKSVYRSS